MVDSVLLWRIVCLTSMAEVPICGKYVATEDANDDVECPADGSYTFNLQYVLPEEETKAVWLATGWEGVGEISMYSEANNVDSLIGECTLKFATSVTPPTSNSIFSKVPIPTAMVSMLVLLAFAGFLVLSCVYQLLRDMATGKKKKKGKGLLDDDSSEEDGSEPSTTDFRRIDDE